MKRLVAVEPQAGIQIQQEAINAAGSKINPVHVGWTYKSEVDPLNLYIPELDLELYS